MDTRIAGALIGVVFGLTLCWSGMADPDVIRGALLFEDAYLYLMFAAAVGTSTLGLHLLRRLRSRALLTDQAIAWTPQAPQRRHIVGSLLFGLGWGVAAACPGPIAAQVGEGVPWALFTLAGATAGVWLYLRRSGVETEPA
jgi:uncharacterized protein